MSRGYSGCILGLFEASRTTPFAAVGRKRSVLLPFSRSGFVCNEAVARELFFKSRA
jgi:hypothetical protein